MSKMQSNITVFQTIKSIVEIYVISINVGSCLLYFYTQLYVTYDDDIINLRRRKGI